MLAHHYTEAGLIEQAIPYWQRAGQKAIERSATTEAIAHFGKGVAVLQTLPDTRERAQQEISLQVPLGFALMATKGYAASEVETVYARARELCRQIGEAPQLFWILLGLCGFYHQRAKLQTALELGEQCLHLAQSMRFDVALSLAHFTLGTTLSFIGEIAPAREQLEQGITLYDLEQNRISQGSLQNPRVGCLSQVAQVLWLLGYPDQALKRSNEALVLARNLSHPFSIAYALGYAARVHEMRKEQQTAQEQLQEQMALAKEQGFELFMAREILWQGRMLIEQGRIEEGIAEVRRGLAVYQTTGSELGRSFMLTWLVEVYKQTAHVDEGLAVLVEALTHVDETGEHFYEAELYRLKGELLLAQESKLRIEPSGQ